MSGYCEIPDLYTWTEPVARKEYPCCECSAPIQVGEKHFRAFGKWAGETNSYRQHDLCREACEFMRDNFYDGECFGFGCMAEYFSELKADDAFFRNHKRHRDKWQQLRDMMAKILWREMGGRK